MGKLKGKRVLVTGGNGYLGAHLVSELKEAGANVFVMDRIKTGLENEFAIDITDQEQVSEAIKNINPQLIYHLAASLNRTRDFTEHHAVMNVNYQGTLNLLNALQDVNYENFVFTSTSEIYGNNKAPFHEKQIPEPVSLYSLSKTLAETTIRTFSTLYRKNYTILRLFNFFGKNMPEAFFIPQMFNAFKRDPLFNMTKGEQARDFLYVSDVIEAMLLAGTKDKARNDTFNVCSNKSVTLKKLATELHKILKSNCKIRFGALPYRQNEVWNMVGDNSKIRSKLGFKLKYNLKSALNQLTND